MDWWGRVWDNDSARQPPPYPEPEATWWDEAYAIHPLLPVVTDAWWAVLPEPGQVHATAPWPDALRRAGQAPVRDRMYEVFRETLRLSGDWERGAPPACEAARHSTGLWRDAAPSDAAPSASQRAHPQMGAVPDCLTTAPLDLGGQLTRRHATLPL